MKRIIAAGCWAALVLTSFAAPEASGAVTGPTKLRWAPCTDPYLTGLECGHLAVPLDPAQPGGKMITIALDRARHTGSARGYQGILLVNPGGPGGDGLDYGADVASALPDNLRRVYDVIGFDPRGVGNSRPALSCDPNYFRPVRPDYVPRNAGAEEAWIRRSDAYAEACGKKYGSLLDHMKTTDVVADMEAIRQAFGQQKINYFGASYGTYLGAVYATLHPDRVRRMVLDSNVRPSGVWYGDNIDQDFGFDASVRAFFAWIASHDDFYHLGATPAEVERAYYGLRARVASAPAGGVIGPDELDDTFQVAAYLTAVWPGIAEAWYYAEHGDAAPLIDRYKEWGAVKEGEFAVYNAVQCTDVAWPRNWRSWHHDTEIINSRAPFQAWGNTWFNAPCLNWPAAPGTPVKIKGQGLPPILLFQATLDAATPFAGGLEMHQALPSSRLVIEDGGRTHAIVQRGNPCVDDKFNAYLATGQLPADRTHCARLPDPIPAVSSRESKDDLYSLSDQLSDQSGGSEVRRAPRLGFRPHLAVIR